MDGLQELHRSPAPHANCVFGAFVHVEAHTIKRQYYKRVVRTYCLFHGKKKQTPAHRGGQGVPCGKLPIEEESTTNTDPVAYRKQKLRSGESCEKNQMSIESSISWLI